MKFPFQYHLFHITRTFGSYVMIIYTSNVRRYLKINEWETVKQTIDKWINVIDSHSDYLF